MPLIQVPPNIRPRQVEFGPDVERSKPGALYFTPGSTKKITKDELNWIRENHKRFAAQLIVVGIDETKSIGAKKIAAQTQKTPVKKRSKDKKSRAKLRAEKILAKNKAVPEPAPTAPAPTSNDTESGVGSGKKKKK